MTPDERREMREAILAGRRALESFEVAADALDSADNWGIFDIFMGAGITSLMKHTRLNKAQAALGEARAYLRAFTRELSDVSVIDNLRVDVGRVLTAVDIFVDNPLVDIFVQKQIDDARDNVDAAIRATRTVLARLEAL